MLFWTTLAAGMILAAGCGDTSDVPSTEHPLQALAPFLTAAEAAALADSDPGALDTLADRLGNERLMRLSAHFRKAAYADSNITVARRDSLLTPWRRIVSLLADQHEIPEFRAEMDYFAALGTDEARRVLQLAMDQKEVFSSRELAPDARAARLDELHVELETAGYALAVSESWDYRATFARRIGRPDLANERYAAQRDWARENNLRVDRCNAIASLIMQGYMAGDTDSTSVLLDRGLRLARASRLASQTGRLLALTGYRDFSDGHYSSSVRSFENAVDACRSFGSPARGLAHLGTLMRLYAVMESWTLVDQVARRADILLTEAEETGAPSFSMRLHTIRLDEIEARSLLARGRIREGHAAYDSLWNRILEQPFEEASFAAHFWITGLLDHGRPDLAHHALDRAATYAREADIRHMLQRVRYWRSQVHFQAGRLDSALVELDAFEADGLHERQWARDLQIPYFALRARILAADDASPETVNDVLAEGWAELAGRMAENDAGAGGFLDLSRARGLRRAAHEEFGAEPVDGYGLELMWRHFLDVIGHEESRSFVVDLDVAAEARREAEATLARLRELDAAHLLYQVCGDQVVRFTAGDGVVWCDTLTASSRELRRLVGDALTALSTDPGDPDAPVDAALARDLGHLARLLLPGEWPATRDGSFPSLLLISGESFLAQIPFAPLNLAAGDAYDPLGARVDLSWVRSPALAPAPDSESVGEGLLIACPEIDPVLTRRYRTLGPLPGSAPEMAAVGSTWPVRTLAGAAATKSAVAEAWTTAPLIYLVGHVIHNPEVPFLTTIPLTPPAGPHLPTDSALDIADIRSADLGACRLAVLSGCGSGAPFADGVITAPSLGDAFLDAGAGAALQTFWRIRDEDPVLRPEEIVRRWKQEGETLPAALSAVRRSAMNGPRGVRHPFGWAAWSLKTGGLPERAGE